MTDKPGDEQHNLLMDYPCEFTIKTMGFAHIEFDLIAIDIIRRHVPDISQDAVKKKFSKSQKYISLSITITAQSKQQMDAIYQDLTDSEHVLMSL
ncbi:MAG: putative lipoic acid-binding regulatory protein [Cycloclasticus sp.]|jgi:putative lipoic acid-binding regulatory protein